MKHYITSDPEIMSGQPCIVGTRIPISRILHLLKQGYTVEAIHEEYDWVDSKLSMVQLMRQSKSLPTHFMPKKFYKHKLLLDENFPPRRYFPMLNHRFDLKHFIKDLKMEEKIPDPVVYQEAVKRERLLVTFNGDDFRPLVKPTDTVGVIAVSDNLPREQIDKKLTALLLKSTPNSLRGRITTITSET